MNKKLVILSMCIAILVMTIGYSAFLTNIKINGTANITSTWNILFTKIEEQSKTDGVEVKATPTASGTLATFNIGLNYPGNKIVYEITVENKGTLDALISKINTTKVENDAIIFDISGIEVGEKLEKGQSKTFTVTISYNEEITEDPSIKESNLQVDITYVQDLGQVIIPEKLVKLSDKILEDNDEQADTGIDFSQVSSDENGKGLYYTSTNTEDNKTTYYFRGNVKNNYVSFAGYYWRIIRINEDGSIRLIYQGESADATGENATIGTSVFKSPIGDNAYVGYMYGTPTTEGSKSWSTSYEQAHKNEVDSAIKTKLDSWYQEHLLKYASYIADTGFCNDRSLSSKSKGKGFGKEETYYGAYERLYTNKTRTPQLSCPQKNDLFTVKDSKGNGALTYPIGLITVDEVAYAGGVYNVVNNSYYLSTGVDYWTMSPSHFFSAYSWVYEWHVYPRGVLDRAYITNALGVRPAINLASTVQVTSTQDGTISNPYIIKTN